MKPDLRGLAPLELEEWVHARGFDPYRGRQIHHWLFKKLASSFEEMANLPKALRESLEQEARITHLEGIKRLVSEDATEKFLFRLEDGCTIESVLIPERVHRTLCVSSQVGCAMGCRFCLTGRRGLTRNLTPAEILEQVIFIKRTMPEPDRLTNIVFMGMGEPLANYDAVVKAIGNLVDEEGLNFSHRRITLSTSGLVPAIHRLGKDMALNLAVSLNGADDETRSALMPINRTYPLKELMAACRQFPLPNRRMITFEYILIDGVNDSDKDAETLARLLSGIRAKINLIPLNPFPGLDMSPPPMSRILRFQQILIENHYTAILRKSKGQDILAACGQLSGLSDLPF
jgi:23S rRNA (adenine2503-C2)-methyltransferase